MAKPATKTTHRTDPQVLKALREAAGRPMTPEQRHQQKVSFIMGTMGEGSTVTREEIERILAKQAG
jgi:hypothetical protein